MPVLPRIARVNEVRRHMLLAKPRHYPLRKELRASVIFDTPGSATLDKQSLQHLDDIDRRDRAGTVNGHAFMGVFIQACLDGGRREFDPLAGLVGGASESANAPLTC